MRGGDTSRKFQRVFEKFLKQFLCRRNSEGIHKKKLRGFFSTESFGTHFLVGVVTPFDQVHEC